MKKSVLQDKGRHVRNVKESDDKYRILFEQVHDGIYQSTIDGKILTANPALVRMLGYDSEDELKKMNIARDIYVNASERDKYLNLLKEEGNLEDAELILKRKDGSHITVLEHSHIVQNQKGEILYYEGSLTDITERKLAEKALRNSEKRYQTLIETSQDGISLFDLTGRLIYFNQRKKLMMGYDDDKEFMHINTLDMIHPDDRELGRNIFTELMEKGRISNRELRILRKDATFFWAEFNAELIREAEDSQQYIMDTMRDITERKRVQEDLMLFKHSIDIHFDGAYFMDRENRFVYVNESSCSTSGYSHDELIGQHVSKLDPNASKENMDRIWEYLEKEGFLKAESTHIRKDGTSYPVEILSTLVRFAGKEYNCGFARDITERKRNAEDMRIRLEQLRQIIDLVPSYIFAKDIDGQFLLVNKALAQVFGLDPEAIVGKTDKDYGASEEQINGYRQSDMMVIEKGVPVDIPEEQVLRKDGTLGWFQTVKIPYKHPGWDKPAILGVATEITERKEIEDELRRSEDRFRKLFESHAAVKLLIDPEDGAIVDANKAASEFYGWEMEKLRSMSIFDICLLSPEDLMQKFDNSDRDKGVFYESTHRLSNGSEREVEIFSSRIIIEDHIYLHTIVHDITEKKKILRDLIVAKEKSEESDRLKTSFLHNISHEIRTPMNSIVGFTSLMESPDLSDETRKQYIDIIYQSSNQLLSIISDIVDISNIETGHLKLTPEKVNINLLLRNLYDQYSYRAKLEKLSFRVSMALNDSNSITVCDQTKLIQVITNLLNNAFKFTNKGSIDFGYIADSDNLQFYVKDTGIGISAEYHSKLFDRFYQIEGASSKPGGTGLGLSICKAYVELMGGTIWIESEPGKGSAFFFTLPFKDTGMIPEDKKVDLSPENLIIPSGRLILIAEDDDKNYFLLTEMLSGYDLTIKRARNGLEAVELCKKLDNPDLVIMDIKMPLMDGFAATSEIRSFNPDLPVVAITAYAHDIDRDKVLASGFSDYLSKPLERNQLNKILSKYLVKPK